MRVFDRIVNMLSRAKVHVTNAAVYEKGPDGLLEIAEHKDYTYENPAAPPKPSDPNREPVHFVYLRTMREPAPQIWYGDQIKGNDKFKHNPGELLFFKTLSEEEEHLCLSELVAKYPPPIQRNQIEHKFALNLNASGASNPV